MSAPYVSIHGRITSCFVVDAFLMQSIDKNDRFDLFN
nr:MAG TPA: hypothetical protein [Caudoviricetes sp.]